MTSLHIKDGLLYFNDTLLSSAVNDGRGLRIDVNNNLCFGDDIILTSGLSSNGLISQNGELLYNSGRPNTVSGDEYSIEGYWIPPRQRANVAGKSWSSEYIIYRYDELVNTHATFTKHVYKDEMEQPILSYGDAFELIHYKHEPVNYKKTIFMGAQIHGDEYNTRLILLLMMEIMLNKRFESGYTAWQKIFDTCRIIIIPIINPYGNQISRNIPYSDEQYGLNLNRNFDHDHTYGNVTSVGGVVPFEVAETQHVRDVINLYGAQNIDYAIDFHDGFNVSQHYWINYNMDAPDSTLIPPFIDYMLSKHNVDKADALLEFMGDSDASGNAGDWYSKTMGISGGTVEWMGGLGGDFGYSFDADNITHSLELRSNVLFLAANNDVKGWNINEQHNDSYFKFDYPCTFSRTSMRHIPSWMSMDNGDALVTDTMVIERWDSLTNSFPTLLSKSESLCVNASGNDVFTYTFGSGSKKVLHVGGVMRNGYPNRIDEYAIYMLIEYLCNDYIVSQSSFLTRIRNEYTIIVLPFVDSITNNSPTFINTGLNNNKWFVNEFNVTTPILPMSYDSSVIKTIIDNNIDLTCIFSGGDFVDTSEQAYQVKILTPKNQSYNDVEYVQYLTDTRKELVVTENTIGDTFIDYAYDNYNIPCYFVHLKVSNRFTDIDVYNTVSEIKYMHSSYEVGRRMSNFVNLIMR